MITDTQAEVLEISVLGVPIDFCLCFYANEGKDFWEEMRRLNAKQNNSKEMETEEAYTEYLTGLFQKTSGFFDWGVVTKAYQDGRPSSVFDLQKDHAHTMFPNIITECSCPADKPGPGDPYDADFHLMAGMLDALQWSKGQSYKDSWRKRGLVGIYHNLCRKWDRIEVVHNLAAGPREYDQKILSTIGESLFETIADLAVYAIKCLTYLRANYPDQYKKWLETNAEHGIEDPTDKWKVAPGDWIQKRS